MKWSSTEIATIMIAMTMAAKTVTPKNKEEGASKRASRIERNQTQTKDPEIGGGQTENECGRKVNYHNVSASCKIDRCYKEEWRMKGNIP